LGIDRQAGMHSGQASLPYSQRMLTFAIGLSMGDLEPITITWSLLQPLVFQAHYCT